MRYVLETRAVTLQRRVIRTVVSSTVGSPDGRAPDSLAPDDDFMESQSNFNFR